MRPSRLQRDLERELSFHVTERMDEFEEGGLTQAQAARVARRQFGNFSSQLERTRDMNINVWLEAIVRNLRYGVRALTNTPAFTVTVVLTLALGIGANSAVFSAIYAVLLRPLPFPDAGELVTLAQSQPTIPDPFVAPVRLEDGTHVAPFDPRGRPESDPAHHHGRDHGRQRPRRPRGLALDRKGTARQKQR